LWALGEVPCTLRRAYAGRFGGSRRQEKLHQLHGFNFHVADDVRNHADDHN
jgi:hypothetical protein